jgi:predicted NAD-dependent protein-ADP-ribosyltransferase YbiA (DUF1768 family)
MKSINITNDKNNTYALLSNYSETPFADSLTTYRSIIHCYYKYISSGNNKIVRSINNSVAPENVAALVKPETFRNCSIYSRHVRYYDINETYEFLRGALIDKLYYNPRCIDVLIGTGKAELIVHNETDNVLGVGRALCGLNMTGKLLMELRHQISVMSSIPILFDESLCIDDESVCEDPDEQGL